MVQPTKWIPGLLPLVALVLVAGFWQQGRVEADLTTRANAALSGAGLDWAKAALAGRDSRLSGEAPTPEARSAALAAADGVFGVRRVAADAITVLPEAKPFTFTAIRDGDRLTLTGSVPPGAARDSLLAAAKAAMPSVTIAADDLKRARGSGAGFPALATYGLGELARLSQGTLSISDSALSLSGRAAGFAQHREVIQRLATVPAGGTLAKGRAPGDILPPLAKPFSLVVERTAAGLTLSGHVPSAEALERLLAEARTAGVAVTQTLVMADGAPVGDWAAAAALLLRQVAGLESGKGSMTDAKLSIAGKAKGLVTESDVETALKALPSGYNVSDVAIESRVIRPYRFEAKRSGTTLTLTGHVPDARARAAILDTARQYFEGDRIDDKLAEGIGEPGGFLGAVQAGLRELARLADGASFSLENNGLALKGLALFDAARDQVTADFARALPAGFQGKAEVATAPLPPPITALPQCQMLYTDLLNRGTVRFESGSADLSRVSRAILDKLSVVSLRCVNARIEIGGHTDNDGSPQGNAELSRRRAETVGAYLVRAGVQAERLEPVGYGQTVPVAPNDTPENKAKNRRIEFFVK
jgi:OOP family OmpA-OmpF porin